MIVWVLTTAVLAREPTVGHVRVPLTPSEGPDPYLTLIEIKHAGDTRWTSDVAAFRCKGVDDWLHVEIAPTAWPSVMPERVVCTSSEGQKVKVKVEIHAVRHEPLFVSDGTLVMPRGRRASVIYAGPALREDLVVQQGKTTDLELHCNLEPDHQLRVIVDPDYPDGDGYCQLNDRFGDAHRIPIKIVTVE